MAARRQLTTHLALLAIAALLALAAPVQAARTLHGAAAPRSLLQAELPEDEVVAAAAAAEPAIIADTALPSAAAEAAALPAAEGPLLAEGKSVFAAAASTCTWTGHCAGDPCTTYNDCDGSLICISGKCGTSGPVAPPPSTPPPSTPPTGTAPGQGRCPTGWYEASLTTYDSWPYPNSNEWQSYSGGKYLGTFAYADTSASCTAANEIKLASWSIPSGKTGSIPSSCHWRHTWVARTRIASVFKSAASPVPINFGSQIAGKQIRVASLAAAAANPVSGGALVSALDTCGDADCNGCCTTNAGSSPSKVLIDLEKNSLKALFPAITGFVATNIVYSGSRAAYQGSTFDAGNIANYPGTVCFRLP